jgi:hypothetical protein
MNSFLTGIKNVLLWSYARGTWQYDLLCLLIVAAVFLVPSRYFGDRDRTISIRAGRTNQMAETASNAASVMEIDADELNSFLQRQNRLELKDAPPEAAGLYLNERLKRNVTVLDYKPFMDEQGRPGYRVWFK